MCFERSHQYHDKVFYRQLLSEGGASQNAWTGATTTDYSFEAPSQTFHHSFEAFLDHLINPLFHQDDIDLQKGIITNERLSRKYYPGEDELSQYALTKWMNVEYYSKEQLFGSDQSLVAIKPETLHTLHRYYFEQPISVFVSGTFNKETLITQLSALPQVTNNSQLLPRTNIPTWKNKSFHEFLTSEIDTPTYYIGAINPSFNLEEMWSVDFILHLLAHEEFGTLSTWIRQEKGWSYGLLYELDFDVDRIVWSLKIPLSNQSLVAIIRKELPDRIKESISSDTHVEATKKRLLLQTSFDLETLRSRLDAAVTSIVQTERIVPESEYRNWLEETVTVSYLESVYAKYFAPKVVGEFLAVPKPEK
jgi:predicted Zn-dependent peptidase